MGTDYYLALQKLLQMPDTNASGIGLDFGANGTGGLGSGPNAFDSNQLYDPSINVGGGTGFDYGSALGALGTGASIASNLAKAFGSIKSANLARKGFDFSKNAFYKNYYSQKENLAAREIKQKFARDNSTVAGGNSSLDALLAANKAKYAALTN